MALAQEAKLDFPGKSPELVVIGDKPLVAETPAHLLDDDVTPTEVHYIRNNGQIPELPADSDAWEITIDGEIDSPFTLTLGELKERFENVTYQLVLECGGNGRSQFVPAARGNPWTTGGVGCARWTGVRLKDVLEAAGPSLRRSTPRTTAPIRTSRAIPRSRRSRAASGSRRRWSRTRSSHLP